MSKQVSLTQYLIEQQREEGRIPSQLRLLIEVVARACKRIAINVKKGALGDVLGTAGTDPSVSANKVGLRSDAIRRPAETALRENVIRATVTASLVDGISATVINPGDERVAVSPAGLHIPRAGGSVMNRGASGGWTVDQPAARPELGDDLLAAVHGHVIDTAASALDAPASLCDEKVADAGRRDEVDGRADGHAECGRTLVAGERERGVSQGENGSAVGDSVAVDHVVGHGHGHRRRAGFTMSHTDTQVCRHTVMRHQVRHRVAHVAILPCPTRGRA